MSDGERITVNQRMGLAILVGIALGGGWLIFDGSSIEKLQGMAESVTPAIGLAPKNAKRDKTATLKLATFQLNKYARADSENKAVVARLGNLLREFDIVALQGIKYDDPNVIPRFLNRVNESGSKYNVLASPPQDQHRLAFVYDTETVLADRIHWYLVNDPQDLLVIDPFVANFRAKGAGEDEAFTFTLINAQLTPQAFEQESRVLEQVFREVRNDGRGEDDVILMGGFHAPADSLKPLVDVAGVIWAIRDLPTNTEGNRQFDNLIFHRHNTDEFTGQSGVFDFLREYNLSLQEALEISDHLPAWAEFSIFEGGHDHLYTVASKKAG